jgi:uncharacterized membrane protein
MTVIRDWVIVEAPHEEVWRIVADPRNLPRWNRYIRSVRDVPEDGLAPGSRYTTQLSVLGLSVQVQAEVEEIDPPRFSRIRLSGPLEATVRTWVRPAGRNRSRLEHEVDYRLKGGPVGEVVARGLKVLGAPTLLKRGIRSQKHQVERS